MPSRVELTAELLARLAALQIAFNPRVHVGQQVIDQGALFEPGCQFPNTHIMPLGRYSYSLSGFLPCRTIGRFCSIGRNVQVFGDRHPVDWASTSPMFYRRKRYEKLAGSPPTSPMPRFSSKPKTVTIGHDVWIGDDVTLRDGITIGNGAIIAAGALVTRSVEPYEIMGGNPAQQIRFRFSPQIVEALNALEFWQYRIEAIQTLPVDVPENFITELQSFGEAEREPEARITLSDVALPP